MKSFTWSKKRPHCVFKRCVKFGKLCKAQTYWQSFKDVIYEQFRKGDLDDGWAISCQHGHAYLPSIVFMSCLIGPGGRSDHNCIPLDDANYWFYIISEKICGLSTKYIFLIRNKRPLDIEQIIKSIGTPLMPVSITPDTTCESMTLSLEMTRAGIIIMAIRILKLINFTSLAEVVLCVLSAILIAGRNRYQELYGLREIIAPINDHKNDKSEQFYQPGRYFLLFLTRPQLFNHR